MSQDTYTGQYDDPLSLNLYTYCFNNPLRYYGPTGNIVSAADQKNLTLAQQTTISFLTSMYDSAKAAGNQKGMNDAHAAAEAIRSSAGYTGGSDGNGYVSDTLSSSNGSSSSKSNIVSRSLFNRVFPITNNINNGISVRFTNTTASNISTALNLSGSLL